MEVNRLDKDELIYELSFRGITDKKTVDEMRTSLRHLLKLEQAGSLAYAKYPFTFAQDKACLDEQLTQITALIQNFADLENSSNFRKIKSKLLHCFKRAERMIPTSDEEKKVKSQLLLGFVTLDSEVRSKARRFKRASQAAISPLEISAILSSTNINSSGSDSDSDESVSAAPAVNAASVSGSASVNVKGIPVSKWNFTRFDGDNSRISLNAFLENVEELRRSRNVSPGQLFSSASDLFMGKALIWFRSIRNEVHSWPELVEQLRVQFLPADYNDQLIDEIRKRTQGATESMGIYIAVMTNMFNRLTVPVNEPARLKILLKNIAPFYQSQLGLVKVNSVKHLLDLGRQLEARKESIESFSPPPRNTKTLLEPDLAYIDASSSNQLPVDTEINISACWLCNKSGHLAATCPSKPTHKRCFKCGTPGFTVKTCVKCNRQNSGNSSGGR